MSTLSKSLLIIEDDQAIQESLKEILADQGFDVRTANNGRDALDYLSAGRELPALILLDIMMPIMNGFEFREQQLGNPRIAQIPTVALSADGNLKEKSEKLKVREFLKKPVDLEQLLEVVEKYCA